MNPPTDKVLSDIRGKIERETKLIQGFQSLKRNTTNQEVIQRCNTQIRETQSNIDYLQETFEKLQLKVQKENASSRAEEPTTRRQRVTSSMVPLYSRFDLIKYDCPSLGHKIQYMLQQLQFKLQVENQYRAANEKISHLYLMDGDKSSSSAAEGGKHESDQRIQILNRSMKKYQGMFVDVEEVNRDLEIMNTPKFARKPLTGRLTVQITCIRDVDHIALPMFNKKLESIVSIKIDDAERSKTNASRNGKFNEEFFIDVDKAHEMEITVYDKSGSERIPVALTWVLLSDIAEEIRKKKVANESGNDGWIPAFNMPQYNSGASNGALTPGGSYHSGSASNFEGDTLAESERKHTDLSKSTLVSAWVNLEPVGQILLTLSFEKSTNVNSRSAFMGALGRHGAIRQKKEEVFEQHGHQFVQKQFYNIMCCALCGEFLRYTGFQCQDCRFLCHKKCYQKVVTKCISKSGTSFEDEAKVNHRIPHRLEPVLNRGTKWCCHCGYILPWGKKNVRKCTECGVMCHTQCTHLVPDFCGMSMEMANKILTTIKSTNNAHSPLKSHAHPQNVAPQVPPKSSVGKTSPHKLQHKNGVNSTFSAQDVQLHEQKRPATNHQTSYDNFPESSMSSKLPTQTPRQVQETVESPYASRAIPRLAEEQKQYSYSSGYSSSSQRDLTAKTGPAQLDPQSGFYRPQGSSLDPKNPFEQTDQRIETVDAFDGLGYNDTIDSIQEIPHVSDKHSHTLDVISPTNEDFSRGQPTKPHKLRKKRRKVGLDDFQFLAVLGKGNFGKVMLAESRQTSKLCAIKVLKKDFIVENEEAESVKSEKRVFLTANKEMHPFLLNLHCCFQTENRIYFVMEYVSGGDLMWHIQKNRFSAKRAKFYACEVLLGLKYFHENGIVYRDLKLDNILLTTKGHIKIGDYGLCKENMWYKKTTGTFCGTPEFMAPEIICGKQYDRSVDWWAFGVLIFQMLLCQSPFKGEDEDDVFNAIEHDEVRYPISMPRQTVLILQALLTKEPELRLGSGERDALDIMEHSYFLDVNFDDVLHMRLQPPYLPEITSEHDYSNFDQEFTSETPRLTPVDTVLTSEMQEQFRGFSHIADDAPV